MNPLAIILGALGSASGAAGDQWTEDMDYKRKLDYATKIAEVKNSDQQEMLRRRALVAQGINPDTLEPIPGYFEGYQQRKELDQKYRGKVGGGKGKGKGGDLDIDSIFK